ncbi:SpoIIIAH-like family protein [Ihubacter sp. rT4E-8]|uniref:SpoIIIAH-like family protein n=1 Tax=Ihubacter sp. rT4E-8 TaxID=3242369 RepID=UPI003CFB5996
MKMKKKKLNIKGFLNKKENVAIMAVAVIFCAGLVVTNVKAGKIPLHDGDVLVDSQNVAQEEALSQEGDASKTETSDGENASAGNTFDEKKAALELERNDLIAKYDDTIKNSSNEAEKKNAIAQKEKLTGYMEMEVAIEGIIRTKNLPDCLVIITDSTVTVTVDEQDLKQNTVAKICNIVMEETKRTADKIIIQSSY